MVSCYVEANPMPHSFKWQFKTGIISHKKYTQQKTAFSRNFFLASKRRRTDLINTVGGAKALDKIKDMVDLPANQFTLEYDHSLLRYRTMTEADYGFLYCWAENLAGQQVCIRNIIMPLKNRTSSDYKNSQCRIVNYPN